MDKFSYSIGLGIGQNLSSMGIGNLAVDDFAQAIKDVLEGNQTAISHNEAREIVNKYFEELESKMGAVAIEQGQAFLEENKKGPGVVVLPSGLQYEIIKEAGLNSLISSNTRSVSLKSSSTSSFQIPPLLSMHTCIPFSFSSRTKGTSALA